MGRVSNKLLILLVLNGAAFLLIIAIVRISFSSIERATADATRTNMEAMVARTHEAHELWSVLSRIELLSHTYHYLHGEFPGIDRRRLISRLEALATEAAPPQLTSAIFELTVRFEDLLDNGDAIVALRRESESISETIHEDLAALETLLSRQLIRRTLDAEGTHNIDQVLSLVAGYRESLLLIGAMLSEAVRQSIVAYDSQNGDRIVEAIEDLLLRLRTINASIPTVAQYGTKVSGDVERYKEAVLRLHAALVQRATILRALRLAADNVASFGQALGEGSTKAAVQATKQIGDIIERSMLQVIGLSLTVIMIIGVSIVVFTRRNINAPLRRIVAGIDSIRAGDLDRPIRLDREDEWGMIEMALNNMSAKLAASYATLHESEAKYRFLVENHIDMVIKLDLEGRLLFVSPSFCETFGKTEEDLLGKRFVAVVHKKIRSATASALMSLRQPPHTSFLEQRDMTSKGWRWLAWAHRAVLNEDGEMTAVVGVGRDVTEQKDMELRLRQSQRMELVGNLAGGVAHEFNNLLMAISGNLFLLERRLRNNGEARGLLTRVEQAVTWGRDLTRQLLAYSRKQQLQPTTTDINAVLSEMIDFASHTFGGTIVFDPRLAEDLWQCHVDRGQLEGAILNLLLNARDAMPKGGTIVIETINAWMDAPLSDRQEEFRPGNYVKVSVRDSGVGMAPDVLARAFDPFFTTKDVGEGTGLGLSMVYGFANQSGGDVSVESTKGRGTTVTLCLPRTYVAETAEEIPETDEVLEISGTILLVEDNENVRLVLALNLEDWGSTVVCASDAASALAILEGDETIDVMLTDIVLPGGVDGWMLARQARRLRPNLKVVYMTGHTAKAKPSKGRAVIAGPVLSKPYGRRELAEALRSVSDGTSRFSDRKDSEADHLK